MRVKRHVTAANQVSSNQGDACEEVPAPEDSLDAILPLLSETYRNEGIDVVFFIQFLFHKLQHASLYRRYLADK